MYNVMRWTFYWPPMANDVKATDCNCQSCARNRRKNQRQRKLCLLPLNGPLQFVAIDILGLLPKRKPGNHYVVVMTDRYSEPTKVTPTAKTTVTTAATFLLKGWISSYKISASMLTHKGPLFASGFFKTICVKLWTAPLTRTVIHPQSNRQAEWVNATIVSRLCLYLSEHQRYWESFVAALTNTYSTHVANPQDCLLQSGPN